MSANSHDLIERSILALLARRALGTSICPSEVARDVSSENETEWRAAMPDVRSVAVALAERDVVTITRRGQVLNPTMLEGGPIRLSRGPRFPESDY